MHHFTPYCVSALQRVRHPTASGSKHPAHASAQQATSQQQAQAMRKATLPASLALPALQQQQAMRCVLHARAIRTAQQRQECVLAALGARSLMRDIRRANALQDMHLPVSETAMYVTEQTSALTWHCISVQSDLAGMCVLAGDTGHAACLCPAGYAPFGEHSLNSRAV
jgi:hypothetical protein